MVLSFHGRNQKDMVHPSSVDSMVKDTTGTISGIHSSFEFYSVLKRRINQMLFWPLTFLASITLTFVLRKLTRKLRSQLKRGIKVRTENYADTLSLMAKLDSQESTMKKVRSVDTSDLPWFIRNLATTLKEFDAFYQDFRKEMSVALGDAEAKEGNLFKHVPSNELWERRTKAYAYRL